MNLKTLYCSYVEDHFSLRNVQYLIGKGIDVNSCDRHRMTLLHYAAESGNLDTVKYLIQAGANVDSYDKFGRNPLHYAAINNHSDIADFLRVKKDSVNSAHEQSQVSMRKRLRVSELQDCTSPCSVEYQHISSKRRRLKTSKQSWGCKSIARHKRIIN
ncbi:hypothetical protein BBB02_04745 [Wolbachia endosymbiont of Bemisia tabaci]|uniref:ankyrin repeat domain-containing protein n=1 Tax=Wolbachia endosymbiont of Bemisia tabaci TaxID=215173 RepID=UPI000FD17046|nr:ankyrin repeat domain-containing protein [Wolbachia endosymbiont of Bemisia tabaci]AZU37788.1 hypothetical protein BBB02_04745 [Wolbachia endosymbiont of Bemisia tabaci]